MNLSHHFSLTLPEGVEHDPGLSRALQAVDDGEDKSAVFGQIMWKHGQLVMQGCHLDNEMARAVNDLLCYARDKR